MPGTHLRLNQKYNKEVVPQMQKAFNLKHALAVPKIIKAVINTGIGRTMTTVAQGKNRDELLQELKKDLSLITGQWPKESQAKQSIASFKTRKGMIIGLSVTLRGKRMYDFLEKVVKMVLPRVRDFHGISLSAFDAAGNLNLGIKEMMVFPELPATSGKHAFGLQITVVTNAKNKEQAVELLKLLGFPLKK